MKTFENKVVAITGVGSGIGRALALSLSKRGARLSLADCDATALAATAAQCEALGTSCFSVVLDVSDKAAVHAWAQQTVDRFGTVNAVINNAGVALGATVEDMCYDDFEWLMNINFWGVVYGTRAFLPHLKLSGDGHVVNISSLFGLMAMAGNSAYNAAKFAVRGFTEALAEELLIEGVPVNVTSVHPGGIDTNIARSSRVTPNSRWGLVDAESAGREFEKLARTSAQSAAEQIIAAMLGNRRRLLIGNDARVLDLLQRLAPSGYQGLVSWVVKRQRRQAG